MYLGETAAAALALAVLDVLTYVLVNEHTALVAAREAEANDNTNDVSYARANDLDYYCYDYCYDYCYCSFVCHTDNHVESGNRIHAERFISYSLWVYHSKTT